MTEIVSLPSDEFAYDDLQDAMEFIGNHADSLDEAIGWNIEVCEKTQPSHSRFIDAKDIINQMQERAYDEFSEWSEDYLIDIEFNDEKIKSLNSLLEKWLDENATQPIFWQAGKNIKTIVVDKELLDKHGIEF